MSNVNTGDVLRIGDIPQAHCPPVAIRPENEYDLLWALRGAGTNFGIVISVVFQAYHAPKFLVRDWVVPLRNEEAAVSILVKFDGIARDLDRNCSADPCIYVEDDEMRLGVTMFQSSHGDLNLSTSSPSPFDQLLGTPKAVRTVDFIGLFNTDMYMSSMHGGHAGGTTSSFKRCVFLKDLGSSSVARRLFEAIANRPTPYCYVHLLQGGGAIWDIKTSSTAFGCRDWDFACVITGVWLRDQDNTMTSRAVVRWVYDTVDFLLTLNPGVYGADLGPDPRDAALATRAFGQNRPRLARLKTMMDPYNILAYACPLPSAPMEPQLIFLMTGEAGAGKDFCADFLASELEYHAQKPMKALVKSISDVTKQEYAEESGASFRLLLHDREYKEHHRPALTAFFEDQIKMRPQLPQEHFLKAVYDAAGVDILLITGMRDEAPVATFAHLVPDSCVVEIRVQAEEKTMQRRRGGDFSKNDSKQISSTIAKWSPDFVFDNETGPRSLVRVAERHVLPLLSDDYERFADMVRTIPNFLSAGMKFRHVLGLTQQPGGLELCSSLMKQQVENETTSFDAIVCCERGGISFATALATDLSLALVIVREAGKLPPPTLSVTKPTSHISSYDGSKRENKRLEMERDVIPRGAKVLIVDDVLVTGRTLCAMLELLKLADVDMENVYINVVTEFPLHRGRMRLLEEGFGRVRARSLLTYGHL